MNCLIFRVLPLFVVCCFVGCGSDEESQPTVPQNPDVGTIIVDISPADLDASWTLENTLGFSLDGTGRDTVSNLLPDEYTIKWMNSVDGYFAPDSTSTLLFPGTTRTLSGIYREFTTTVLITVFDRIGGWENLAISGELTGGEVVSAAVRSIETQAVRYEFSIIPPRPGQLEYGLYDASDAGSLTPIETDRVIEATANDEQLVDYLTLYPTAQSGFLLFANILEPTFTDVEIWSEWDDTRARTGMSDDLQIVYRYIEPFDLSGTFDWGPVENDGSESGIWLVQGETPQITIGSVVPPTGRFSCNVFPNESAVTFAVDMSQQDVSPAGVYLVGSFGADGYAEWPDGIELIDADSDGIYEVTLSLSAGSEYQFVFNNGDDWENVPAACGVDSGFGSYNRILIRTGVQQSYQTEYGGCPALVGG